MTAVAPAKIPIENFDRVDELVERTLNAARIPGVALAVVAEGKIAFAKGYGYRDRDAKLPMRADTAYPIASTTKAINATLLGMLVDEGRLAWDAPVQRYLSRFRLKDPLVSAQVTVRDLLTMRTGLARHDWLWINHPITRAELLERLPHLELSAGFRESFQYNNLTVTVAGHIAECITGTSWEELVRERIFRPLGMNSSGFLTPEDNFTRSYHETHRRELIATKRLSAEVTAPSGGAIHSTVEDMARWMQFNLNRGQVEGCALIQPHTIKEIHGPQIVLGAAYAERFPHATYALGWLVDTDQGFTRLSHTGSLHDVDGEILLIPEAGVGIVSFSNFDPPRVASVLNRRVAHLILGLESVETLEQHLARYENKVTAMRERNARMHRIENTRPSHTPGDYVGVYAHAGYGEVEIKASGSELSLRFRQLNLPLQHWHYDVWAVRESDLFPIHEPHAFDPASRVAFETNVEGEIAALSIRLEPAVAPIRFEKATSG